MLASDHAKLVQEIPDAEFSALSSSAAMPTSPTEITKVHFCQKCQSRTFNLGARSNTERAFKGGNDSEGGKLLEYSLIIA